MGGYQLGVDVGTTFTAAATVRDGRADIVGLGDHGPVVPTVVHVDAAGEVIVGQAAARRAVAEPDRVAREFKRRLGDPAPLLLGGAPFAADLLVGRVLEWTVGAVTRREGGPPDQLVVCHPATWGPYKLDLLAAAARRAGVADTRLLPEPVAAAHHYAATQRLEPGAVLAVYDFGGGTFDATVLRRADDGVFAVLGRPEGIERLGGIDVDEAVFRHVLRFVGDAVAELDRDDPAVVADLARLRRECTEAKEALSSDTETAVPVVLPTVRTEVRLSRSELEELIRGPLRETVAALRRALDGAGVAADELDRVLLVGGSSRIPLVAELVTTELGRPVTVDAHPKHAVALGAALVAGRTALPPVGSAGSPVAVPAPRTSPASPVGHGVVGPPAAPAAPSAAAGRVPAGPLPPPAATAAEPPPAGGPAGPEPRAAAGPLLETSSRPARVVDVQPSGDARRSDGGPVPAARPRRRRATVAALLALVAVATAVGVHLLTAAPSLPPGCPEQGPALCIQEIRTEGGGVVATLVAHDAELSRDPVEGQFSARFFLRSAPSAWVPWGSTSPFRAELGATGGDLCVLLDDHRGRTVEGSGNCVPL